MSSHAVLDADTHRDLRVLTHHGAALGDDVMYAPAIPSEFRKLQNDYPILFRMTEQRDDFVAVALFGFETGENLFLVGDRWDAGYLPLAHDIQPFLIGRPAPGDDGAQVHIDLASPRLGSEGVRMFDEDGRATPFFEAAVGKLGALDEGHQASADFFAALHRHDLLEPMSVEITLDDRSINRLVGFHVIDEARLRALDAAALGELHAADHLLPIFMAMASLGRLTDLVARKNRRIAGG